MPTLPPDRRLEFRIGINLGDVIVEGDDLFGDGVNIAARLQALADPGGIFISGGIYDQIRTNVAFDYEFLGAQSVKTLPSRCGSIGSTAIPPPHLRAGKRGADGVGR